MKRFDGEFISAETGDEEVFGDLTHMEVVHKLRSMKDGDAIVVNARVTDDSVSL